MRFIPTADRTKATIMVKVTILDKDDNLKPEVSARVTFRDGGREVAGAGPGHARSFIAVPRTVSPRTC